MDTVSALRGKYAELVASIEEHYQEVVSLQQQALREIVPDLAQQFELGDDEIEWVEEYLRDTGASFGLKSFQPIPHTRAFRFCLSHIQGE